MTRLNVYERQFTGRCCNNNAMIVYSFKLETSDTVMVEQINAALDAITEGFHETIADELHDQFGGVQTIVAHHHGVDIKSVRTP